MKDWELPEVLNTDKAPTYAGAIAELKAAGKCPKDTWHRQVKYLNNVVEADHGKLKQLIRPVRGFKVLKTAYLSPVRVTRKLLKTMAVCSEHTTTSQNGRCFTMTAPATLAASAGAASASRRSQFMAWQELQHAAAGVKTTRRMASQSRFLTAQAVGR